MKRFVDCLYAVGLFTVLVVLPIIAGIAAVIYIFHLL